MVVSWMPRPWAHHRIDRMISLGGRCETAFQLRRLGGASRAFPFDWWITPLAGVASLLRADPSDVFATKNLFFVDEYDGGAALYCHFAGTVHLHETSPRNRLGEFHAETLSHMLIVKYERLFERMRDRAVKGRTLFVRQRLPDHDPNGKAELERCIADIDTALAEICQDHLLLLVDYPAVEAGPRVLQANCVASRNHDLGINWRWTWMLARRGLMCRSRARANMDDLFDTLDTQTDPNLNVSGR